MSKKLLVGAAAAVLVGMFVFAGDSDDRERDEDSSAKHETTWNNQVWIDKIPVRETDKMNIFAAIDDPQLGLFQSASQWEGDYTIFTWQSKGDGKVEIEMMQTNKKHKLKVKLSTKDCGRFDVCMTIKGAPRGPKTYYSMRDWVIEGSGLSADQVLGQARSMVLADAAKSAR